MNTADNPSLKPAGRPLITIAIPTYNRATWIKDCVQAALAQSYRNFEILVSNNASTDATAEMLSGFKDPRLRVITQKNNIGMLPNWNACLAEAKGEYIIFVSDDDRVEPWLLERCAAVIQSEANLAVIVTLADIHFFTEDRIHRAAPNRRLKTGAWDGIDILQEYLTGRITAQMCSIMFRTESIRRQGGFRLELPCTADRACMAAVLFSGRAGFVNESCAIFGVHATARTADFDDDRLVSDVRTVAKMITVQADHSIDDVSKRRRIKNSAKLNVALCALYLIDLRQKGGAGLGKAISLLWHWRHDLANAAMGNPIELAKPIVVLFLPAPATRLIRFCMSISRRLMSLSGQSRQHSPLT